MEGLGYSMHVLQVAQECLNSMEQDLNGELSTADGLTFLDVITYLNILIVGTTQWTICGTYADGLSRRIFG
jgi:hypothetical protein